MQWLKTFEIVPVSFATQPDLVLGKHCTLKQLLKAELDLLKPTGYVMHQQVYRLRTVYSVHTVFKYIVFTSEQTAISALYNIN